MLYLRLFWEFFKTGLFSIGGGMATVPFLQEMSVRTGWFNSAELADMIAVAESTPGPLGVNMGTYVGYTTGYGAHGVFGGILGGFVATIGLIFPSIVIILIIATILAKFRQNRYVNAAFYGLRPASLGLIVAAGLSIILICFFRVDDIYHVFSDLYFDWRMVVLAAVLLVGTRWIPKVKKLHPIWFIAFSAVIGIVFRLGGA